MSLPNTTLTQLQLLQGYHTHTHTHTHTHPSLDRSSLSWILNRRSRVSYNLHRTTTFTGRQTTRTCIYAWWGWHGIKEETARCRWSGMLRNIFVIKTRLSVSSLHLERRWVEGWKWSQDVKKLRKRKTAQEAHAPFRRPAFSSSALSWVQPASTA